MVKIDKDTVLRNLKKLTSKSVMERAYLIAEKNKNLISLDFDDKVYKMSIKGSKPYAINVEFTENNGINANCNCDYDWGGFCKHIGAAVLFLLNRDNDLLGKEIKKQTTTELISNYNSEASKRNSQNQFRIENYFTDYKIDYDVLKNKLRYNVNIKNITPQKILLQSKTWTESYDVAFTAENNDLLLECNCLSNSKGICSHAKFVLNYTHEKNKTFFNILTENGFQKLKQKAFKEFGLNMDLTFEDYFNLDNSSFFKIYEPKKSTLAIKSLDFFDKTLHIVPKKTEIPQEKTDYNIAICVEHIRNQTIIVSLLKLYYYKNRPLEIKNINDATSADIKFFSNDLKWINTNFTVRNRYENDLPEQDYDMIKQLTKICSYFPLVYIKKNSFVYNHDNITQIFFSETLLSVFLKVSDDEYFVSATLYCRIGTKTSKAIPTFYHDNLALVKDTMYLTDNDVYPQLYKKFGETATIKCAHGLFPLLFQKVIDPLTKHIEVVFDLSYIAIENQSLTPVGKKLYLTEQNNLIKFLPVVTYDNNKEYNALESSEKCEVIDNKSTIVQLDKDFHENYITFFKSLHSEFENQMYEDGFYLTYDQIIAKSWFIDAFEKIRNHNIEIFGLDKLKKFNFSPYKASVNTNLSSGIDWFDVEIDISYGDMRVSLKDLQKAIVNKQNYVQLGNGKLGLLPEEWIEKFAVMFRQGEIKKEKVKISKLKFSILDQLFEKIDNEEIMRELYEKKEKLKSFTEIKNTKIPKNIKATLRDYQKEGLNWLNFLNEFGWGGILADDMGLGKTLQIITLITGLKKNKNNIVLIVVPTTLLFNWKKEIEKFAPHLTPYFHHGLQRLKTEEEISENQLIISTYGTVANDIEMFQNITFYYTILDESQAIKNPNSQRYKSMCLLKSKYKIAMTGTPIENNTFDLYAQMNFLNPGVFGSQENFKTNYSTPIDVNRDEKIASELQKMISPFVLRRTKEQVATELPPKVEDYLYCEMEPEQRAVYDVFKNRYRDFLMQKFTEEGFEKSKMFVLEGILKLRQICDSPTLLNDDATYTSESIKIKEIIKHITEKTANHKILVFSQFVGMLKLIETELQKNKIEYEYLDGKNSQTQREESVDNFQNNEKCRVFLISLKAGGFGLNLTSADYVYIVDPWWNPAVENQAIDRCYRIGQDKHVIAYRMICKDTIEEKIMDLQQKKKQIASDIIHTDENIMKQFDKTDVLNLFN